MCPEISSFGGIQVISDESSRVCDLGEKHARQVGTRICHFDGVEGCSVEPSEAVFCPVNEYWGTHHVVEVSDEA